MFDVYSNPMLKRTTNPSFMNGVPELLILRMLSERAMYGYELVQAIRVSTNKVIAPGEGVIYPILHGLERKRLVSSREVPVSGRIRVYYRVTPKGGRHLTKSTNKWRQIAAAVAGVLGGKRLVPTG